MPSTFGWVDYDEEDRRRMADLVNAFNQSEARDELGIGVVRDALADILFPGTSTIQTRAAYFLFCPWIFQKLECKNTSTANVSQKSRKNETDLIDILANSEDTEGVIGIEARATLQRLPSNIYWAGMGVWGIRKECTGSQTQYFQAFSSIINYRKNRFRDEDGQPISNQSLETWDPGLPEMPKDFPHTTTFALNKDQAEYLKNKILSIKPKPLLAHLVSNSKPAINSNFIWEHPEWEGFPDIAKEQVEHARNFSEMIHGAALLYNLMLSQSYGNDQWEDEYLNHFSEWSDNFSSRANLMASSNREEFWKLVHSKTKIPTKTKRFIERWFDLVFDNSNIKDFPNNQEARNLIISREKGLKKKKAKLDPNNRAALERWQGSSGTGQLTFRWLKVRRIVADILNGLEG